MSLKLQVNPRFPSRVVGTAPISVATANGTYTFSLDMTAVGNLLIPFVRQRLTGDRVYYVRVDGNESNTGTANTVAGAWLTPQHAYDWINANLDTAGFTVYISIGPGTFPGIRVSGNTVNSNTLNPIRIIGSGSISTTLDGTGNAATAGAAILIYNGAAIAPSAMTLKGAYGILAENAAEVLVDSDISFGTCTIAQILALYSANVEIEAASYTISGSAPIHAQADEGSTIICFGKTINLANSPVFTNGMLYATGGGRAKFISCTFSGAIGANSKKFYADTNGVVLYTGTTLPGSIAGTWQTGGISDLDSQGVWTPVLNSFTVIGGTTLSGTYTRNGRLCHINCQISAATSVAATAGTSWITGLPFTPSVPSVAAWGDSLAAGTGTGTATINATGLFTTTWAASNHVFYASASYIV